MDMKTLCALFMGGALGVGGTVTVQKAADPKPAVVKAKPRVAKPATRNQSLQVARPSSSLLSDCPLPSADISPFGGSVSPVPGWSFPPMYDQFVEGGWIFDPSFPIHPPTSPTVPETSAWGLMIGGFGLVGIVARRRALA